MDAKYIECRYATQQGVPILKKDTLPGRTRVKYAATREAINYSYADRSSILDTERGPVELSKDAFLKIFILYGKKVVTTFLLLKKLCVQNISYL